MSEPWKPPVYGFGLLVSCPSDSDPMITGGLDETVEVVDL